MKKTLLTMVVLLVSATGWASVEIDGIAYSFDKTTMQATVEAKVYSGDVVIPETVVYKDESYTVTAIGKSCFAWMSDLKSVVMPNTVTKLSSQAFYCSGLTNVTLSTGLLEIGRQAFGETNITSIAIPDGVTIIGDYAFDNCPYLTTVSIPASVTQIGGYAFMRLSALKDVYMYATSLPFCRDSNIYGSNDSFTIHVPAESMDDYKNNYAWSELGNIVALTEDAQAGVEALLQRGQGKSAIFDLSGRRLQATKRGVNIIGCRKVLVN